jgi:hypothetical protein
MNKTMIVSIILGLIMIVFLCVIGNAIYYELKGEAQCARFGYEMGGGNRLNANCYQLVSVEWDDASK